MGSGERNGQRAGITLTHTSPIRLGGATRRFSLDWALVLHRLFRPLSLVDLVDDAVIVFARSLSD